MDLPLSAMVSNGRSPLAMSPEDCGGAMTEA